MKLFIGILSAVLLAGCGGGGGDSAPGSVAGSSGSAPAPVPAPAPNAVPVANAGVAQSVSTGSTVTADGTGSTDADNNQLTYMWTITSKPANSKAVLSSTTSPKPSFLADVAGDYVLSLIVNDGKVDSSPSTIKVTAAVANAAPVGSAGVAQNAITGTIVTLDGSASSDANGDALSYSWVLSRPSGSSATLSDPASVKPTFVPDVGGAYVATLSVSDGKVSSVPVSTTVTATLANAPPVANAGAAKRIVSGSTVSLDATGSSDANGDALTYSWTLTSAPAGSQAVLNASNTVTPSLTTDLAGVYVASLSVSDGKSTSPTVTTTVTAVPRLAGALGISFTDQYNFCGMVGTFNTVSTSGSSTWTVNNCLVYGTAGSNFAVRIQNNGNTSVKLTEIDMQSSSFAKIFFIGASLQTIGAHTTVDFNIPLWLSMEVTNATATFRIEGEPDLVAGLKGSVILP